jgi:hypothetical protein
MADAFEILFKPLGMPRFGREFGGAAQTIFLIFSMGSHILTWTICFSTLTNHATCNMVWGVVALILFWIFDLPRTLRKVSWFSIACKQDVIPLRQIGSANILCSIYQYFLCCSDYHDRRGHYGARQESVQPLAESSAVSQSFSFCNEHCLRLWYVGVDLCGHVSS